MSRNTKSFKDIRALMRNPIARVIILIVILFAATYGGVEVLRVVLSTESPLMVVSSGSMVPTLNVGDIIVVHGVDPKTVNVGTIIIFHSPYEYETPIVHRVIAVLNGNSEISFQTKGDHNQIQDGWKVPAANLIGVYVMKVPYLGLISLELRGPLGVTLIVVLVALIIAVEYKESKSGAARRK